MPLPNNKKSLRDLQYEFTRYLRDPENVSPPEGVDKQRAAVYQELVYNGIANFIANSFPVLRKITADDAWHHMLHDYICNHQSRTPLFPKMPLEFLHYLQYACPQHPEYPDFILELATYEWSSTCIKLDVREIDMHGIDTEGDLLMGVPVLNPVIMPQTYKYPVHQIGPNFIPDKPSEVPVYLLVYRRKNDRTSFIELNPVSARLVECIQTNDNKIGMQLLQMIVEELNHPEPQVVIKSGHEMMLEMQRKDIILGVRSA